MKETKEEETQVGWEEIKETREAETQERVEENEDIKQSYKWQTYCPGRDKGSLAK